MVVKDSLVPAEVACEQTLLSGRTGEERRKEGSARKVHQNPFLLRSDEEKFHLAEICSGVKIGPPTSSIKFSAKLLSTATVCLWKQL